MTYHALLAFSLFFSTICVVTIEAAGGTRQKWNINRVEDALLCNNVGSRSKKEDSCYISDKKNELAPCDSRIIAPEECLGAEVIIVQQSSKIGALTTEQKQQITDLFIHSDFNNSVRRLHITYPLNTHEAATNLLDELLTPRPWLFVRAQTFPWLYEKDPSGAKSLSMTIDKYNIKFEPYLRAVGAIHYPVDKSFCDKTAHIIGRNSGTHPGWAAVFKMHYGTVTQFPYAVFQSYLHGANETAYTSYDDCPSKFNRWECSFLKTSNCTPPEVLISDTIFLHKRSENTDRFSPIYLTRTAKEAVSKDHDAPEYKKLLSAAQTPSSTSQQAVFEAGKTAMQQQKFLHRHQQFAQRAGVQADYAMWWWFYFFRSNNFYRDIYEHYLHTFKETNGVDFSQPNQRCVVAQVRRGEHIQTGRIEGGGLPKNVSYYCEVNAHLDVGCGTDDMTKKRFIPFAYIGLDNLAEGMKMVNNFTDYGSPAKNMILFSDDGEWVKRMQQEAKSRHLPFKVFDLPFSDPSSTKHSMLEVRFGRGTAHFLASLHLAQQCEALVGNFQSLVPGKIREAMCLESNGRQGVCPPFADLRKGDLAAPFHW